MISGGLIHVYTGDGKGKTTSAIGLAVRALGHNRRGCYAYFHKRPEKYGYTEIKNIEKLGATVFGFAKGHPFCDKELDINVLKEEAQKGLAFLKQLVSDESFDMLILDEIIISVRDNFIAEEELLDFIKNKPSSLELVMTGRGASPSLTELADYVSNITKVKHPYDKGITCREGIEF